MHTIAFLLAAAAASACGSSGGSSGTSSQPAGASSGAAASPPEPTAPPPGATAAPAAYDPCSGKKCGDACSVCPPDAKDCMETMVVKACSAAGLCEAAPAKCP